MKRFIPLILSLIFISPIFGQTEKGESPDKEISQKDSIKNFLLFIEGNNKLISDAYNGLSLGLKAISTDSIVIMTTRYTEVQKEVVRKLEQIEVASFLVSLKFAYINWIKSKDEFFSNNSYKLIELRMTKRTALSQNPEADIKYIDKQVSDFFKEMDEAQTQMRNLFILDVERLNNQPEPPTEIKK